ncbi:MAG: phospholipase A [Panacagrimonas sp.]
MSVRPSLLAAVLVLAATTAQSQDAGPPTATPATDPKTPASRPVFEWLRTCDDGTDRTRGWLRHFASTDGPAQPVFGTPCDVDWHKPIFMLPYTYSRDYESAQTEVLFGVSAKLRPLGPPLYFAYSQRSFWSLYDSDRSRPFRETNYNPEIFYRYLPARAPSKPEPDFIWGLDGGYEHESNGRNIPESRSWDRLYVAPFFERGGTALQLKIWYRLPEDAKKAEDDASGDDNPDIDDFYGYSELHVQRRIGRDRRYHLMVRGNPATGRGAVQFEYSWRIADRDLFWHAYFWHGYGESLQDYNDSVTRLGIGFALAR